MSIQISKAMFYKFVGVEDLEELQDEAELLRAVRSNPAATETEVLLADVVEFLRGELTNANFGAGTRTLYDAKCMGGVH